MNTFYEGKKILLIGGTGSIGSAMTKRLLEMNPQVIRIFSRDEFKQFNMENHYQLPERLRFLIGDVRDYDRVSRACEDIDIIFHMAAMKHVPSCEYNPFEAVRTNVVGTQNVILAAMANGVDRVVLTSSDKAISPTNAMGATKLLAERLMSAAHYSRGSSKTVFSSVRFGNVMGSRGSVINLFMEQILKNRRITLTEDAMTRFMMTHEQAVALTLKSAALSTGGETFVLKMPVIRLIDLAEVVVEETCSRHGIDPKTVEIQRIGLRPGEKMYEELMTEEEFRGCYDLQTLYSILPHYPNVFPAYSDIREEKEEVISSDRVTPIPKEQVREMVMLEKLI